MNRPIAVRSLQCPDHAHNIPPKVLSALWFLGKRCNYDCSYCSPHIHDAVSPFVNQSHAVDFINHVDSYCKDFGKKMKWGFTGGEPFLDPGLLHIAKTLRSVASTDRINVITNGSLPIGVYQQASGLFDGITVSLHLERAKDEIDQILSKFAQIKNTFVSVNLMLMPGKLGQVKGIVEKLQDHDINFIVRKINPPTSDETLLPYKTSGHGKKDKELLDTAQQKQFKLIWSQKNNSDRSKKSVNFYSQEELDYLAAVNTDANWINCGVWYDNTEYEEQNSDYLVSNELMSFKNWICYAGVDNIYIDFDGTIYRGMCQNDGPIGHISEEFSLPSEPTVCQRDWCTCNVDIPIRKAQTQFIKYVDGSQ